MDNLAQEVAYRGLKYTLDKVEDGQVFWTCTYSQHKDSCSVESWKSANPYGGH